jgi:transposase
MSRERIKLTSEQVNELQVAQDNSTEASSALRFQAVRLYGTGYPVSEIEAICRCRRPSLLEWRRKYQQGGVAALLDHRAGGNRAFLSQVELEALQQTLQHYRPQQLFATDEYAGAGQFWTVATLALLVERHYGVRYKRDHSYRVLFARCGFSYQRTSQHYLSRSEQRVMAFEETLEKNCSILPKVSPIP